tara:strand:- start:1560 stop:1673 length:114 start_codon:yes stop_codon:yes gene_type:complete
MEELKREIYMLYGPVPSLKKNVSSLMIEKIFFFKNKR